MGSFYTAGLDPLFWLHHANIDRLWEVWLKLDPAHVNPTGDPAFLDTTFTFPDPESGSVTWSVGEVLDTEFLGYVYESLDAPAVLAPPHRRTATPPTPARRRGAGRHPIRLDGGLHAATHATASARRHQRGLPRQPRARRHGHGARPQRPRGPEGEPARVYLRVEGVTGTSAAPLYGVYLNVPEGEDPHDHPELRAGSFSTFGLVETSQTNEQHDAEGLTASFDITALRERLGDQGQWDDERVRISFSTEVPGAPRGDDATADRESAARPDVRARRIAILVD